MIPANIQGLTFARSPQMVRSRLLLAVSGCWPACVRESLSMYKWPKHVVWLQVCFQVRLRQNGEDICDAQNINILTIGSPDGIGGFFPKVKFAVIAFCAASCRTCPVAPVAPACCRTVQLGVLGWHATCANIPTFGCCRASTERSRPPRATTSPQTAWLTTPPPRVWPTRHAPLAACCGWDAILAWLPQEVGKSAAESSGTGSTNIVVAVACCIGVPACVFVGDCVCL